MAVLKSLDAQEAEFKQKLLAEQYNLSTKTIIQEAKIFLAAQEELWLKNVEDGWEQNEVKRRFEKKRELLKDQNSKSHQTLQALAMQVLEEQEDQILQDMEDEVSWEEELKQKVIEKFDDKIEPITDALYEDVKRTMQPSPIEG